MSRIRLRALLGGCGILFLSTLAWADYPTGYDQAYIDAVNYCKAELTTQDIDYHLTTITTTDPVLMTCFTDWAYYDRAYIDNTHRGQLWCTVAGEQWQFYKTHQTSPETLLSRTKQLLGLPSNNNGNWIVEFWVDPSSLFRPAVDESLTNPVTNINESEASDWYKARKADIYRDAKNPPYPWTRAGYTYDWGTGTSDHVGLSEFVARSLKETEGTPITVRSVFSPVSYLYYVRETDSFNVTDWCSTIWCGTKYLPATVGGNQIDIAQNVTIYNGDGILVTDLAGQDSNWVINNRGVILGPGSTLYDSSMAFVNAGGTLNNYGIITGDAYGVLGDDASSRPITITNSGTITGTVSAIQTGGGNDVITTNGTIIGNILTRGGNDTINVTGGTISGNIDGGTGTNTLNFNLPHASTFLFTDAIENMTDVNINTGTVKFGGDVTSNVTVGAEGILGGSFCMTGLLTNEGILSPGNSIGVIDVAGNYEQAAGSRYIVEVARSSSGTTLNDQLIITGTANLAANSIIDVRYGNGESGSVFQTGDTFEIISAGVLEDSGSGVIVTADSAFLTFAGEESGGNYYLMLTRSATFRSAATSGNNAAMGGALDGDAASASGAYADFINHMLFTNSATFNSILQQLSPATYLTAYAATDRTTQYMAESTGDYLRKRRAGQINPGLYQRSTYESSTALARAIGSPTEMAGIIKYCANENNSDFEPRAIDRTRSVWANPFGVFYGERTSGDHLGFQSNVAGIQFGIDKQLDESWIAGIGGGYCQTHLDTNDQLSAGTINTFRVGPYATWYDGDWYLDMSLTGGFHDNSLSRYVDVGQMNGTAQGDYHANDLSLYYGLGRDYRMGAYTLTPQASLQYIYYRQNYFTETGADEVDYVVDPRNANSLRSRFGGQLSSTVQRGGVKVVREVFAGWAHEYLGNDPLVARFVGGVTPFSTDRGGLFRDAGYYGIGLTAIPSGRTSLFARYNGEYSSGGHFTAVDLGLTYAF